MTLTPTRPTDQALFSADRAPGLADRHWRLKSMQMINWGGFSGHHSLDFDTGTPTEPGSTLIVGASGSGKSTIMDAYLAVMMENRHPFNRASNDGSENRSRNDDERTVTTYIRGKLDREVDDNDTVRDKVLRGDGVPVWGALAVTFIDNEGALFTPVRAFYVKADATARDQPLTKYATFDSAVNLRAIEAAAAGRFNLNDLKRIYPGWNDAENFTKFESRVHTRLGIGAAGSGRNAMKLLSRVHAGKTIKTVDNLYKELVLDEPITFTKADAAIAHFASLEGTYQAMQDEGRKVEMLQDLPDLQTRLAAALIDIDRFDRLGPTSHRKMAAAARRAAENGEEVQPPPFQLWAWQAEFAALDEAEQLNRSDWRTKTQEAATARTQASGLQDRLDRIARDRRANGGDALDSLDDDLRAAELRQGEVQANRVVFDNRVTGLDLGDLGDRAAFEAAQAAATAYLAEYPTISEALAAELSLIDTDTIGPLQRRKTELDDEIASFAGRTGRVPMGLHQARVRLAEAAGLHPQRDLPFIAELLDIDPDHEQWRTAMEATLGGLGRMLLIEKSKVEHFRTAINTIPSRQRLKYRGVLASATQPAPGDPALISGKVHYAESPFAAWVQRTISSPGTDHLCVEDVRDLNGPGPRVTLSGQASNGDGGAHGGNDRRDFIFGFTNERRLAELREELAEVNTGLDAAFLARNEVRARQEKASRTKERHQVVLDTRWDDIDTDGLAARIARLQADRARLVETSDILKALDEEAQRLTEEHEDANRRRFGAENRVTELDRDYEAMCTGKDTLADAIDSTVASGTVHISAEDRAYLDGRLGAIPAHSGWRDIGHRLDQLSEQLRGESAQARGHASDIRARMSTMFARYNDAWGPFHDLDADPGFADQYREILDRLQASALYERKERWLEDVAEWSSEDLLTLHNAFEQAKADIFDRLDPVNDILRRLPFGTRTNGYLKIEAKELSNAEVAAFQRKLRALSSGLTDQTPEAIEARFKQLREFMGLITVPPGHTKKSTSQRDRLLDVRAHVEISARYYHDDGAPITYTSLSDKSGGETQELVGFILGSALRFHLGDQDRQHPRFAPVMLDEGFVKADSEHAGRSVRAWQELGFQLIVSAPFDKFSGLEPHMDLFHVVNKAHDGHASISTVTSAERGQRTTLDHPDRQ